MTAATPEWHPHLRMALASRRSPTPTHKTLLHPNFAVKLLSNHAFPPLPPSPSFRPQFPSAPSPCSPPCGSHHHPEPRRAGRYRRQAPNKTKHKGLGEGRKEGKEAGGSTGPAGAAGQRRPRGGGVVQRSGAGAMRGQGRAPRRGRAAISRPRGWVATPAGPVPARGPPRVPAEGGRRHGVSGVPVGEGVESRVGRPLQLPSWKSGWRC